MGSVTIRALNNKQFIFTRSVWITDTFKWHSLTFSESFVSVNYFLDFMIILKTFKSPRFWHLKTKPRTILLGEGGHVGGLTKRDFIQ